MSARQSKQTEEEIEQEILRQLTTPKMVIPDVRYFEGSLNEEELKTLTPQNKLILLGISSLGKRIDYSIEWLCDSNRHARLIEADIIRRRLEVDKKLGDLKWKVKIGTWVFVTLVSGVLVEVGVRIVGTTLK